MKKPELRQQQILWNNSTQQFAGVSVPTGWYWRLLNSAQSCKADDNGEMKAIMHAKWGSLCQVTPSSRTIFPLFYLTSFAGVMGPFGNWSLKFTRCSSAVFVLERFLKNRNREPRFLHRNTFIYYTKTPREPETRFLRNRNRLSTCKLAIPASLHIAFWPLRFDDRQWGVCISFSF